MPGKLCNGVTGYTTGEIRNSRAFCEGYKARAESGSPVDPHVTGSEASVSCGSTGDPDSARAL